MQKIKMIDKQKDKHTDRHTYILLLLYLLTATPLEAFSGTLNVF